MVYLRLEKDAHGENKVVEVKLNMAGHEVFAKEHSNTFESAVDLVIDKIKAQVKNIRKNFKIKYKIIN